MKCLILEKKTRMWSIIYHRICKLGWSKRALMGSTFTFRFFSERYFLLETSKVTHMYKQTQTLQKLNLLAKVKGKTNYVGFSPAWLPTVETKGSVRKPSTVAGRFIASIQCTEEEDNRDIRWVVRELRTDKNWSLRRSIYYICQTNRDGQLRLFINIWHWTVRLNKGIFLQMTH